MIDGLGAANVPQKVLQVSLIELLGKTVSPNTLEFNAYQGYIGINNCKINYSEHNHK